jgi:ABC-2 type transport system ATP-binding protein
MPTGDGTPFLAVEGLAKTYRSRRGAEVRAVSEVSFTAGRGQVLGLLGPNGAGKTTTIKSIAGLIRPSAGSILIGGFDALAQSRLAARQTAVVLEGNRNVYWRLTVRENLDYFAALRGLRRRQVAALAAELIERFRLADKADVVAMKLSRGMQQKLALACAVVVGAPLLLLDEPTLGLDVEISYELRSYLRSLAAVDGCCVVVSSHDLSLVSEVCDRAVIITGGRVVADDTISGLVGVFNAIAVRLRLSSPLAPAVSHALTERFGLTSSTDATGRVTVEVALADSDTLYEFLDQLRRAGAVIESLVGAEPELEDVFLSILERSRP